MREVGQDELANDFHGKYPSAIEVVSALRSSDAVRALEELPWRFQNTHVRIALNTHRSFLIPTAKPGQARDLFMRSAPIPPRPYRQRSGWRIRYQPCLPIFSRPAWVERLSPPISRFQEYSFNGSEKANLSQSAQAAAGPRPVNKRNRFGVRMVATGMGASWLRALGRMAW